MSLRALLIALSASLGLAARIGDSYVGYENGWGDYLRLNFSDGSVVPILESPSGFLVDPVTGALIAVPKTGTGRPFYGPGSYNGPFTDPSLNPTPEFSDSQAFYLAEIPATLFAFTIIFLTVHVYQIIATARLFSSSSTTFLPKEHRIPFRVFLLGLLCVIVTDILTLTRTAMDLNPFSGAPFSADGALTLLVFSHAGVTFIISTLFWLVIDARRYFTKLIGKDCTSPVGSHFLDWTLILAAVCLAVAKVVYEAIIIGPVWRFEPKPPPFEDLKIVMWLLAGVYVAIALDFWVTAQSLRTDYGLNAKADANVQTNVKWLATVIAPLLFVLMCLKFIFDAIILTNALVDPVAVIVSSTIIQGAGFCALYQLVVMHGQRLKAHSTASLNPGPAVPPTAT